MASVQVLKALRVPLRSEHNRWAMLYTTNDPDLEGYSGYVQAGVAELDTTELRAR